MQKKLFLSISIIFLFSLFIYLFVLYFTKNKKNVVNQSSLSTEQLTISSSTATKMNKPAVVISVISTQGKLDVADIEEIEESLIDSFDLEEPGDFDFSFDF